MFWSKIIPKDDQHKNQLQRKIGNLEISDSYIYLANIIKTLIEDYGFKKSVEENMPVDSISMALPLYTYPTIEYLNSLDFKNKKIFEFGLGNSTIYWLNKSLQFLVSVENNQTWIEKLSSPLKDFANHQLIFAKSSEYINSIQQFPDQNFDVIIIDGSENRYLCARNSITKVSYDGMIILDNSDWYPKTAQLIKKELDFIQIDFYGFRPSKANSSVTSLFLSRRFNFNNSSGRQPNFAIGGLKHISNFDGNSQET